MKISLHLSGLIFIISGILFTVSAVLSKSVLLYISAVLCIICGVLLTLPKRNHTKSIHRRNKSSNGKYSA